MPNSMWERPAHSIALLPLEIIDGHQRQFVKYTLTFYIWHLNFISISFHFNCTIEKTLILVITNCLFEVGDLKFGFLAKIMGMMIYYEIIYTASLCILLRNIETQLRCVYTISNGRDIRYDCVKLSNFLARFLTISTDNASTSQFLRLCL